MGKKAGKKEEKEEQKAAEVARYVLFTLSVRRAHRYHVFIFKANHRICLRPSSSVVPCSCILNFTQCSRHLFAAAGRGSAPNARRKTSQVTLRAVHVTRRVPLL